MDGGSNDKTSREEKSRFRRIAFQWKVEVKGGLQAGDKVAVSKLRFLSDGMPVDIISQKEKRTVAAQK